MSHRLALAAALIAALPVAAQLRAERAADLSKPVVLAPGQGAIQIGFARPDSYSVRKSGVVGFARYDLDRRDLIGQPRHAKKLGDTHTYWVQARARGKSLAREDLVFPVSEGDYVLYGANPGPLPQPVESYCFSSVTFHVDAGELVYFGDLTPYMAVPLKPGARAATMVEAKSGNGADAAEAKTPKGTGMVYVSRPDAARGALANQPALAAAFRPAALSNGASFGCAGAVMSAYRVDGLPDLPPPPPAAREADAPPPPPEPADAAKPGT